MAKILESIKEKKPDEVPVTTEISNNNSNETINTETPATVQTSTEKVIETTVSVITERYTESTSTKATGKPSTKTSYVNNVENDEKYTTSDNITPESDNELKKVRLIK